MRASKAKSSPKDLVGRSFAGSGLADHWQKLHKGDMEPFPDSAQMTRFAKRSPEIAAWIKKQGGADKVAAGVQEAWRRFHCGDFAGAIAAGSKLGAPGATAANKAAAIHSLQAGAKDPDRMLEAAIQRGERAVAALPDYANAHYMLSVAMGRHSQRISILQALANGIATRVRTQLEATLKLEPRHAEAQIALGMYHAEIVAKVGTLLASLTYGASPDASMEHFRYAIKLTPAAPIALIEYANALTLLDAHANHDKAQELYARAAALVPADAMEELDVQRAQRHLA
jgi:tetratricopeptide (TPR) repeat protein